VCRGIEQSHIGKTDEMVNWIEFGKDLEKVVVRE
jgi:hypothetical protein